MLRTVIIQRYLDEKIIKAIWHNYSVHIPITFKVLLKLWVLFLIYIALTQIWLFQEYIWYWVAAVAFVLMIKYCIDFFNLYLDALVLTKRWIKVFIWENVFEHKIDEFEREHLQVISFEENTIWDRLFWKWDINVALTNNFEFSFDNVTNPQKITKTLYHYKDKFLLDQNFESKQEDVIHDKEKFDALVETFWEVMMDYMNKNKE